MLTRKRDLAIRCASFLEASSDRKATTGIMESWQVRVHIDPARCFSAVGSTPPGHAAAPKGGGVHPSKSHVSWVKYGASQYGLYLLEVLVV